MQREPILKTGVIMEIIMAFIAMALSFGWVNWNPEQINTLTVFLSIFIPSLGTMIGTWWFARMRTKPLDKDGNEI